MENLVRKNILNFDPYKPGKPLEEVQRELGLEQIMKLASNENPLGVSPKAKEAIKKSIGNLNRYPDGNCFYLKQKLSEKKGVDAENIIFGNGSNEIIELIIKTFMEEGEEVIMSKPDFLIFKLATLQENGNPVEVKLDNFKCDLNGIKQVITKRTKLVFIANPNNPVGTYVNKEELEEFIRTTPKDIIIVLDEAYYEFAKSEEDYPESLNYLDQKNIIILRTFSKAYGLSGLRLGYGIANERVINYLNNSRQPFNVNSLAQIAGKAALDDDDFLKRTVKTINEGKEYLYKQLKKLNLKFLKSATNFILINVEQNSTEVFNRMLQQGVIVRDMSAYGLDSWIRVTVGKKKENQRFIKELKSTLKGGKN